jgi:carbon starvation protein
MIFVLINLKDAQGNSIPAWKAIWPVFGACNQLLAGLVALVIAIWLNKTGRKIGFILGPVLFMNIVTIWALILLLRQYRFSAVGVIAAVLFLLALVLIVEVCRTIRKVVAA